MKASERGSLWEPQRLEAREQPQVPVVELVLERAARLGRWRLVGPAVRQQLGQRVRLG